MLGITLNCLAALLFIIYKMTRGNYDKSKNYLKAKLENFGKGNDTPYFNILKWNWMENESIWQWAFIEWTLKQVNSKETQYWLYVTLELEDAENNAIQWWMKLGRTMRNILFKLYVPAGLNKKIKNINLKTGVYNEKKYVSILIDWEKYDNPFSKWNEAFAKYDVSEEITSRVREVKDPETWEVVKRDETKLDEWIVNTIIPAINDSLVKESDSFWEKGTETKVDWTPIKNEVPVAEKIKEANKVDEEMDLPF